MMEAIQEGRGHSGLYLLLLKAEACFHPRPRSGPASWQLYPAHDGRNARRTKGKRESFKKRWGRTEWRGGGQVLKGGCYSFLSTSLSWFGLFSVSFALYCCVAPPSLTWLFLIQIAGCKSTCLENTVAFLSFKHAIRHRARTLASVVARSPELCPAFLTVDKRRLINFTPSFQK